MKYRINIVLFIVAFVSAGYLIKNLSYTKSPSILNPDDFKHYIDYFNRMEDENIAQAIPNEQTWEWMRNNIPLFECPQDNFEEIYYFRWWTLRKHIKRWGTRYKQFD